MLAGARPCFRAVTLHISSPCRCSAGPGADVRPGKLKCPIGVNFVRMELPGNLPCTSEGALIGVHTCLAGVAGCSCQGVLAECGKLPALLKP